MRKGVVKSRERRESCRVKMKSGFLYADRKPDRNPIAGMQH